MSTSGSGHPPILGRILATWRRRSATDHWSSLFGEIAVASFVICSVTGIIMAFFYEPSTAPVTYRGSYPGLQGVEMSRALESTVDLSLDVRGGLLLRQMHHWSASVMIAAVMVHLLRVFFTGAFRGPRGLTWLMWFGVLLAGMGAGLTGHVLPDDALSGTSLLVTDGLIKAIPVIGTWLSFVVYQGDFPSGAIGTFYPVHAVVVPVAMLGLLVAIGLMNLRHGPARFRIPEGSGSTVGGIPVTATVVRGAGLFCIVFGVLTLMSATATVNPVWLYGPSDPSVAAAGGGVLWYLAFLDGAQRLVPPGWEFMLLDSTWTPAILVPLAVGGGFFLVAMIYPFLERWVDGDTGEHHLLTRPRDAPNRTGIGVAGMVFFGVLWIAGGSDVIALTFELSNNGLIAALRLALILGPVIGFVLTRYVCLGLQHKEREIVAHGAETGQILRSPEGGYSEIRQPVDARVVPRQEKPAAGRSGRVPVGEGGT